MCEKMNSDIINDVVLPSNEDGDIPSNYASLADEHSYCASILSTNTVSQDLFENGSELCNDDMDTRIIFPIGDVNLDGFNYSVPSVTVCDGESLELENMWGGLNSETGTTVVEVAASNEQDLQIVDVMGDAGLAEMRHHFGVEGSGGGGGGGMDDIQSQSNVSGVSKSKPRRTDFIQDAGKRKIHFDLYFRKLTSDFNRVRSRTGCEGTLSALFEGRFFDSSCTKSNAAGERGISDCCSSLTPPIVVAAAVNESLANVQMDDHRYAATMLTQNVSSSAVRDHQYDEKTITSAPDSDTTDYDEDYLESRRKVKFRSNNSKRYRTDYIKVRWERTQTFAKLVRSLFTSKIVLGQRTGAEIKLSLEFERIVFNDGNFKIASNVITARRNQLKSGRFHLLPTKEIASVASVLPQQISTTSASLTFILPDFTSYPFPVPCIQSSSITGTPIVSFPASVATPETISNMSLSIADTTSYAKEGSPRTKSDPDIGSLENAGDSNPTLELVQDDNVEIHVPVQINENKNKPTENRAISEECNIATGNTSNSNIPAFRGPQDIVEEQLLAVENNSLQNSPQITRARGMKESATNTEPICSICFSSSEISNNPSRGNGDHSTTKSFWIRCNDPFCYDTVHASCVGFVVTHSAHLKQLPAFYCKSHR